MSQTKSSVTEFMPEQPPMTAQANAARQQPTDPIEAIQTLELARLMRDNNRLSRRMDFLVDEIRWLRQQNEQIRAARELDQARYRTLTETAIDLIDRVAARIDPEPAPEPVADAPETTVAEQLLIEDDDQLDPPAPPAPEVKPADEEPEIPKFFRTPADTEAGPDDTKAADPAPLGRAVVVRKRGRIRRIFGGKR